MQRTTIVGSRHVDRDFTLDNRVVNSSHVRDLERDETRIDVSTTYSSYSDRPWRFYVNVDERRRR